jgi:hypothetical protein
MEARCRALHLRGRRVKLSQHDVAQALRIALTGLRNVYDFVGEHFISKVAAIREPKRYPRHFVCEAHDPDRLGIELVAIEVGSNRHADLPVAGGSATDLSHRRLGGKPLSVMLSIWHSGPGKSVG